MQPIAIVDYGAGNISSVKKALEHLGAKARVTADPNVIAAAQKIVVPGVGHFCRCQALNQNLRQPVLVLIVHCYLPRSPSVIRVTNQCRPT